MSRLAVEQLALQLVSCHFFPSRCTCDGKKGLKGLGPFSRRSSYSYNTCTVLNTGMYCLVGWLVGTHFSKVRAKKSARLIRGCGVAAANEYVVQSSVVTAFPPVTRPVCVR